MKEIWKDIYFIENGIKYDYRNLYQVSNLGNVKSLNYNRSKKEKILKKTKNKYGYSIITLYKNREYKKFKEHRLVAHMFCDGYFDGAEVDHINTIRDDNRADNLRWVTSKENSNNELTKEKLSGENHCFYNKKRPEHSNKMKNKPQRKSNLIERWDKKTGQLIDIKYQFEYVNMGFSATHISSCCKWYECGENLDKWHEIRNDKPRKGVGLNGKIFIFKYHKKE